MQHLLMLILGLALLLTGETSRSWAAALDAPLRQALATTGTAGEIPVIVTLNNQVAPAQFNHLGAGRPRRDALIKALRKQAEESQQDLRLFLKASGVRRFKPLWSINGLAFQATPELLTALAARPEVAEVRLDGTISAPAPIPSAITGGEWNIATVGAPQLWGLGLTGSGVVVASLDSGVDPLHPDLAGNYRGGLGAWFDPNDEHLTPYDHSGHGTAVMGVLVGGAADGAGIGMAPATQWIAAKIFNDRGTATYSGIHQAYAWTLDPDGNGDSIDAPQVVNNSWDLSSTNLCLPEFQKDIQLLKASGIAVVFSGGNGGPHPTTSTSPANYPESLAVGAVNQAGGIASFSGRGPSSCPGGDQLFPRLAAPGVNIKSADLTLNGGNPDPYGFHDGTSFSAPHVSGLIALLLGQNGAPATSLADLETALEKGADDLGPLGPDQTFGRGLINGLASLRRLQGQPHLAVYDPRPPEHDHQLDFGSLPVGAQLTRSLTLRNSGGGLLVFADHNWAGLSPALTVTEDLCSGQSLISDQTCGITVRFAP
ncbi:MAG TPA: S8 family serine peptidase, partial [Desulfurivibrionaceae bacterium]|nr:S8 family serine peptidase [Desulfurivibrionaceae bacterium]